MVLQVDTGSGFQFLGPSPQLSGGEGNDASEESRMQGSFLSHSHLLDSGWRQPSRTGTWEDGVVSASSQVSSLLLQLPFPLQEGKTVEKEARTVAGTQM